MKNAKVEVTLKHDKGRVKVRVYANSIDEAIKAVIKSEGAPESAVIRAQVVKPTIGDIKEATLNTSPYFFSRETLRFFGQRMSDFTVARISPHEFRIAAPIRGTFATETVRIFDAFTGELKNEKTAQ